MHPPCSPRIPSSIAPGLAWVDKDLNTALGSWAERRHDTILYAKQSETATVAEPPPPPPIIGHVEPCPEVNARLAALAAFMRDGLVNRGLYDVLISERLGGAHRPEHQPGARGRDACGCDQADVSEIGSTREEMAAS